MTVPAVLASAYESIVRAYLSGAEETALTEAYLLGRDALTRRAGLIELIALHHDVLERIIAVRNDGDLARRAGAVLAEAAAPFEMAQSGFQEANAALRELTNNLRAQVDVRTHELSDSLRQLEEVSQERRRLLAYLVQAQEAERRRIAGEIHDDSIQITTALAMRLGALAARSEGDVREAALRAEATAHQAIARLRGLMFELRPPALEREGLGAALLELRHRFRQDWSFDWLLEDHLEAEPPMDLRVVVFRIAQEALTNARKHSRAERVRVVLEPSGEGVRLQVVDDGIGFDVSSRATAVAGHLGMVSMRERAEMAGGWFRVRSQPGDGTAVEAWLPNVEPHGAAGTPEEDPLRVGPRPREQS